MSLGVGRTARSGRAWRRWHRALRRALPALLLAAPPLAAQATAAPRAGARLDTSFAATFARLSEPAGYFDTDNLISNESGYLHVITRLRELGVRGGAYVGVGPDQNYSYIAAIRPSIAYITDVRRDNALQHLMFKALFARSRNRMEFLCRWLGRPVPRDVAAWDTRTIADIVTHLDRTPNDSVFAAAEQRAVVSAAVATRVPLTAADQATIARFHGEFIRDGLDLRFTSFRRAPRPYYPTLRQLMLERDLSGAQASYLAKESDFQFVRALHERNRIIPVVADLAGSRGFPAVAREIGERGERLSALYTSNVEYYLWGNSTFPNFAQTVTRFPRDAKAVVIRSYFGAQFGERHPLAVDGYMSTQLLQTVDDFARRFRANEWGSYWDLVSRGAR